MGITGRTRSIGALATIVVMTSAGASACVFHSDGLGAGETSEGADTTGAPDPGATSLVATSAEGTGGSGSGSGGAETTSTTTATTAAPASTGGETTGCTPLDWYPDGDGDGFGAGAPVSACEPPAGHVENDDDCDDDAFAVHPSANEICDQADNDCDGQVDEFAATNDECGDCSLRAWGDSQYAFCDGDTSWEKARARCVERGGDLVIIEDQAEFEFLRAELQVRAGEWWIGASDLEDEGEFRWHDGAPLPADDERWAWSQPDDGVGNNGDEDCVVFGGANSPVKGEWHDTDCEVGTLVGATRPLCERPWKP